MALTKVIGDGLGSTNDLNVETAIPNIDIKDTGTAQSSMDFLSNSDTVRATIGMERSAGGGLCVGSSAYAAVFGTASSGNTEFATNNNIQMKIDSAGHVTMPNQPAFLVSGTAQNNIANGTTLQFGTEVFDQNSDFASNAFTAPVTGRYQLSFSIRFVELDSAASYYIIRLETSNRNYNPIFSGNIFSSDVTHYSYQFSILADMDANDTASVVYVQSGGTTQVDNDPSNAYFSGYLVC